MARASTPTLLSLDRYAKIMGINPAHFNTGSAVSLGIFPTNAQCSGLWWQYAWQHADQVSREDLARAIYDAEQDIKRAMGFSPAPNWEAKELHKFDQHYRRDAFGTSGMNVRGQRMSVKANYGKVISGGQRAVSLVGTATTAGLTLVYTDADSDGFYETATITLPTTLTDACEIKLYFAGHSGNPEWEIRPVRSKAKVGANVVIVADSWMLIDPDLWEFYPTTTGATVIDIGDVTNFVVSVDVYREYNDATVQASEFYWELEPTIFGTIACSACGGSGCAACSLNYQAGCLHARDKDSGIVVPSPATYDSDDDTWVAESFNVCRDPDQVKLWYQAGDIDERFLREETCEPLSDYYAHAIAWLATARLERDFCACNNSAALATQLRQDLSFAGDGGSYATLEELLSNPFGTKRGEWMAWKRIGKMAENVLGAATI